MPRYGGPSFQSEPARTGFSRYTVDVFSPELPCGVGWLASALLELQVPLWRFWGVDIDSDWLAIGERQYRYSNRFSPWSRIITGLTNGREFCFRASPVPRFTHDLPGGWRASDRLVAFVRDPRDALYSQWRRESSRGLTIQFAEWLQELDARWGLPRLHAFAMDIATWVCFARSTGVSVLTVRFEDTKLDPETVLLRVWSFIATTGAMPNEAEFAQAIDRSQFAHARGVEDQLIADGILSDRINFRGLAYEYKHRDDYDPATFDGIASDLFEWLGYEPLMPGRGYAIPSLINAPWLKGRESSVSIKRAVEMAATWIGEGIRPTFCSEPMNS